MYCDNSQHIVKLTRGVLNSMLHNKKSVNHASHTFYTVLKNVIFSIEEVPVKSSVKINEYQILLFK